MNESGTLISSLGKEFYHKEEPKKNQHLIPLKEALSGNPLKYQKNPDVNEIIDSLTGKKNSRRINEAAINKARNEAKKPINENYEYLSKKLGEDLAGRIWKALSEKKTSLHEKVKINGKSVAEFTLEELQSIFDKVTKKIDELEQTTKTEGLNETDATNAEKKLALDNRLKTILTEEIEFRGALKEADDVDSFLDQFNLNPNAEPKDDDNSGNDDTDKSDDNDENKSDDNADDNTSSDDDSNSDDNDNPDNDEVEEIGSIVLTMASEQAANELKDELIAEGIPEDVIEIEAVEDEQPEDEENAASDENNAEENNTEENNNSDENNNEETPNESASSKVKTGKLNEDDENQDNNDSDANADDNAQDNGDDNADANADDSEEKQFKVILTNTDYADKLQTVMQDIYGIEKSEFEDMIGGTIVEDDEDKDNADDNSSDDSQDNDDNNSSDENKEDAGGDNNDSGDNANDSDSDEIDPETVFKGL